ncbi:MAG: hypothetical protein OEW37_05940 [Rhodospirillaceae bacterium]|nr:hypothetical protein [Rhodospirillaceae bacterium]
MGKFANAFMSLFLDEKARKSAAQRSAVRAKEQKMTTRDREMQALREKVSDVMTPERQELIQHAMKVRTAKAKILDDLSDEHKQKLYALAIKSLLREGKDEGGPEGNNGGNNG